MGYFISGHDDPNYRDESLVGSLDLSMFVDEASIGSRINVPKLGQVQFYVYGKEGKIPHFHIISTDHSFESCLCIYEAKYFTHGSKTGTFNRKQLEEIDRYLRSEHPVLTGATIWQIIANTWDDNNGTKILTKKSKQPDYSMTVESIH